MPESQRTEQFFFRCWEVSFLLVGKVAEHRDKGLSGLQNFGAKDTLALCPDLA